MLQVSDGVPRQQEEGFPQVLLRVRPGPAGHAQPTERPRVCQTSPQVSVMRTSTL